MAISTKVLNVHYLWPSKYVYLLTREKRKKGRRGRRKEERAGESREEKRRRWRGVVERGMKRRRNSI